MSTPRPQLLGTFGMVASTHWLASAAGMAMLERGGNAYDAAVATGFVLQVVEPHLNGPAGEVPIIHQAAGRDVEVVCGQGPAPRRATISRFRELGLELIPGTGLLAACVPGAFAAWTRLLAENGTMELGDVMAPAIAYARDGYPVSTRLSAAIREVLPLFEQHWVSSAATWLVGGRAPRPGTLLRNPTLASILQRLADAAAGPGTRGSRIDRAVDAFYRGFVADAIVRFAAGTAVMDTSGRAHHGLIEADDLDEFSARVEPALSLTYAGKTIHKPSTWTQGLVFLQQLAILSHTDVGAMPRRSADFAHVVTEAAKLAFADREAWYGDPDFVDVPVTGLLDPDYNRQRAALIGERASLDLRPGRPDGREPILAPDVTGVGSVLGVGEPGQAAGSGEPGQVPPAQPVNGDTVHVDVVDHWGNYVAATPSGAWLQSSPTIPELGFCLGTRAQMFWLEDGLPGSLAGGKRPRSTLTPTLATDDDGPWLAFGSPGGDNQDQWSLTFLLTALHHESDLQLAIDAPTFYNRNAPDSFYPRAREPGRIVIEGHADAACIDELRARGHDVVVDEPSSQGWLSAVGRAEHPGLLRGAANARDRQGYVVGR